ncbi:NADPH-dependent FMN reductase [Nakamurella sp. YIM 132087]|uniref:NADPH-dependent FMN reductase n=1 Tax=Nakamurella alba TaxID=2665158 RepID=A0A7K1FFZ1_9ACTN|nr:NADPH-dependent FMN reductase [Nakamurella alba]MTD13035.1 NADPH-dependent FMN reductase [Nakamurella alba]
MSTLKVIIASTRPGRIGLPIGTWITEVARRHGGVDRVEVLDLATIDLPMFDEPHHPRLRQYVHPHTQAWSAAVDEADAFVIVSPEYNFSFTGALKNALDYLSQEWAYKPVGLVTYGGISGGTRAAHAIRQVASVLKMVPVPEAVALPMVFPQVVDGEFVPTAANEQAAGVMLDEIAKLEGALAPLRQPAVASTPA